MRKRAGLDYSFLALFVGRHSLFPVLLNVLNPLMHGCPLFLSVHPQLFGSVYFLFSLLLHYLTGSLEAKEKKNGWSVIQQAI